MIIDAVSRHKTGVLALQAFRAHIDRSQPNKTVTGGQPTDGKRGTPKIAFAAQELPTIKEATDLLVREALQRADGNQSIAAGMLGISQQALSKRLKKARKGKG